MGSATIVANRDIKQQNVGVAVKHHMLKDAATGYVSIQTVCSVRRADLYRAWT